LEISGISLEVSKTNLEVSGISLEISKTNLEVSGISLEISKTSLEVSGISLEISRMFSRFSKYFPALPEKSNFSANMTFILGIKKYFAKKTAISTVNYC
jgi:hypothetical protein